MKFVLYKLGVLFLFVWAALLFVLYIGVVDKGVFVTTTGPDCDRKQLAALKSEVAELRALVGVGRRNSFFTESVVVYVVTPTYANLVQKADLTRFSHTLLLVPNVHWIVVEDADHKSETVGRFLRKTGLNYTHLNALTPPIYKLNAKDPNWLKPRGVDQRNAALSWLRRSFENDTVASGVVYFADDDNTYDLDLFREIRSTNTVSVFPVGLVGGLKWEGPKVVDGKVTGWISAWKPERPFPIDMAGFAVNLQVILNHPLAEFHADRPRGFVESSFLESIVTVDQLEPKARNGTKVLVWHTRTEKYKVYTTKKLQELNLESILKMDVEV